MVIILNFDSGYYKWAPLLIESYMIHEPESKILLYTINLNQEQIKNLNSFPNVYLLQNEVMIFNPEIASRWLYQIVCRKGQFILDAMTRFKDEKLFINSDIDLLLVNPLAKLKKQMVDKDMGLIYVAETKIASGFIVISNTERGFSFIKEYNRRATNGFLEHNKDQPVLAKIYNERKNIDKFLILGREYIDHLSRNNSILWSAHKSKFGPKEDRYNLYKKKLEEIKQ